MPRFDNKGREQAPGLGSFAARFGRVILQHGIAALPSALYHFGGKLELYAQHVWFISYILSHKWDEDLPYPSLGVMSRCSGMSKRQLQRYSDELREMGYLLVYPRVSQERGQEANAYDFAPLFGRLEGCIIEKRKERLGLGEGMSNSQIGVPLPVEQDAPAEYADSALESLASLNEVQRSERDTSFVARYGRVISHYGVAAVPRGLFTFSAELGMTPQQVWFISYIFSYQWDTALPYPSIMRMASLTGYTPAYLHRLKSSLVERGYLQLVHRTKSDRGQDSNAYDFSPLLEAISNLLQPSPPTPPAQLTPSTRRSSQGEDEEEAGSSPVHVAGDGSERSALVERRPRRGSLAVSQRRDRQITQDSAKEKQGQSRVADISLRPKHGAGDIQYTDPSDSKYSGRGVLEYIGTGDLKYTEEHDARYTPPGVTRYTGTHDIQAIAPATEASYRPTTGRSQAPVTQSQHKLETKYPEKNKKGDSRQTSPAKDRAWNENDQHRQPYSRYIVQVITDFSYELGDAEHVLENASQAQRLWRSSALSESDFVELMYNAKRSTREGQGKHGIAGLSNKMAYYFECLRRLVRSGL